MTGFSSLSLRIRVIILVLAAVVPTLGLGLWYTSELQSSSAARGQEEALRLVRKAASDQNQLIEATHQLLVILAQLPVVRGNEDAACSALFADLYRAYPMYAALGVVQLDGSPWCSSVPVTQAVSAADRTWFRRTVQTGHFAVGDYQIGRVTGKATVNIGQPVLDDAGKVQRVVFAAVDLDWLRSLLAEAELAPGSMLTVMDHDGTILARYPPPEPWTWTTPADLAILRSVATSAEGTTAFPGLNGSAHLQAFKTLAATPDADLLVYVDIPTEIAFAEVGQTLIRSRAGLVLVTAVAFAGALLAGNVFIVRPINALLGAAQRLGTGDLSARSGLPHGIGQLGQLARAFDTMAGSLEQGAAQLRSLLAKSISIQEEERARIARDMHDGVIQLITAARYELRAGKVAVESGSSAVAEQRLGATREVLDELEKEIRQAIYDLHPPLLDGAGLIPALRRYARSFGEFSGIACQVEVRGARAHLPAPLEIAVFRMVEEALQNAATHGEARKAKVTLKFRSALLEVTVQDDGAGFDYQRFMASRDSAHLGLISIRERSESLGGAMDVRSEAGHGTSVVFWLPLPPIES
jgi:signal transduction histidine kinase